MDKIPESKSFFSPSIKVSGETFPVELTEYRDYFVLSAKINGEKVVAVPGFDIRMMNDQLHRNILYYIDQKDQL
ncbi:hypothetical protein C4B60_00980 [Jeotgalibacillus proteolyticus]|uniref:Uncharacterized protein n=1 Tax=Jeotgalibacillus proteolyticus TaxID=2082395 RepID=A0A2S5GGD2_9BACL|nr:hypothetical protein C4B60_00980 [Jeotgalibacillus proteolyticus]